MTIISIDEIQRDLLGWLARVQAGETLVILRGQTAIAEVKPVIPSPREPRPFGLCAGEFRVPEGFDEPLPEQVLHWFEGL